VANNMKRYEELPTQQTENKHKIEILGWKLVQASRMETSAAEKAAAKTLKQPEHHDHQADKLVSLAITSDRSFCCARTSRVSSYSSPYVRIPIGAETVKADIFLVLLSCITLGVKTTVLISMYPKSQYVVDRSFRIGTSPSVESSTMLMRATFLTVNTLHHHHQLQFMTLHRLNVVLNDGLRVPYH
jgi:hypothetical protein